MIVSCNSLKGACTTLDELASSVVKRILCMHDEIKHWCNTASLQRPCTSLTRGTYGSRAQESKRTGKGGRSSAGMAGQGTHRSQPQRRANAGTRSSPANSKQKRLPSNGPGPGLGQPRAPAPPFARPSHEGSYFGAFLRMYQWI